MIIYFILGYTITFSIYVILKLLNLDGDISIIRRENNQTNLIILNHNKQLRDTEIGLQDLEKGVYTIDKIQNLLLKLTVDILKELQSKTKSNVKKESGKKSTTKKV